MTDLPDIAQGTQWSDTSAREWRNLMEAVNAFNSLTVGNGLTLNRSPNLLHIGMAPSPVARQVSGVAVSAFVVKEVLRDALRCVTWDGATEGDGDVIILRPYLLQRTPSDQKQRDGEWFDFSGLDVDPRFRQILDDGQPIVLYDEDHITRLAFRYGDGRDRYGNPVIEKALERILPVYFVGDTDEPDGFSGIEHAEADVILAAPINAQQTMGPAGSDVTVSWIEVSDRQWYVVSRVRYNATTEPP